VLEGVRDEHASGERPANNDRERAAAVPLTDNCAVNASPGRAALAQPGSQERLRTAVMMPTPLASDPTRASRCSWGR